MILTDQGSNFLSEVFSNVCKLLKIKKIRTTAYCPQSNGALERTHRVLVEYLRCFILEDQSTWDRWLPYATFVFNTTPHTATGFTPMSCCSAGSQTYLVYCKRNFQMFSIVMTITLENYSLDYSPVTRQLE